MVNKAQMEDLLRQADPVPESLLDRTSPVLFASILERRDEMTLTDIPSPVQAPAPRPRRAALGFALAMAVLLVVITATVIWVGTSGGDDVAPDTPTITSAPGLTESWNAYGSADGVPTNCLCSMAVTADGSIWVADHDGLARFDGTSWAPVAPPRAFGTEGNPTLAAAPDGSLWITGANYLAQYVNGEWSVRAEMDNVEEMGIFEGVTVTTDGSVWVQREIGAALLVDAELWQVDSLYRPVTDPLLSLDEYEGPNVPTPLEGPDGAYWFSAGGWGTEAVVGRVLDEQLTTLDVSGEGPGGLLGFAGDGSLWFTAEFWGPTNWVADDIGVLLRFDGESWTSFDLGGVGAAVFPADGSAWFTVEEITGERLQWMNQYSAPGLYRFDGNAWHHFTTEDWLPGLDLTGLTLAPDGSLWIATAANGVVHYVPGTEPATGAPVEIASEPLAEWPDNATTTTAP